MPPTKHALDTPKIFQRLTGTHEIIASLLLADLFGILLTTLFGALIGAPTWWLLHTGLHHLHTSLVLDIAALLIIFSLCVGRLRHRAFNMQPGEAWGTPSLLIGLLILLVLIFFLIRAPFLTIPASSIPAIALKGFPWPLPLSAPGAEIAALLSLLAHLLVLWRYHDHTKHGSPYARAHPDGDFWLLIEQAYCPLPPKLGPL